MAPLLKNLYNEEYLDLLSAHLQDSYPEFAVQKFKSEVLNASWKSLELKERMRHISTRLKLFLPQNFQASISILKAVFSKMNFAFSLENMIFQDFVEVYGLNDFKVSISALEHFTINSSSEFAIRRFILKYPQETMKQMRLWALSDNFHVRRLASEGCRPRLPWAIALSEFKKNPSPILEILEILKNDDTPYVRKSVANNINDISKENPEIVKKLAKEWLGNNKELDALVKHGCRTLLKSSDKEILKLFGFLEPTKIRMSDFIYREETSSQDNLDFSFTLYSDEFLGMIRVEYALYFLRKNGVHNKKVFQIFNGELQTEKKSFSKSYSFKEISTRKYYKGVQKLSIIVNGVEFMHKEFTLSL